MDSPPSPPSWRSRAPAVLPLVLLHGVAESFTMLSVFRIFRSIACPKPHQPHIPEVSCQPEDFSIIKNVSQNMAIYILIATVLGILVSGPYSRALDFNGKKKTMRTAAVLQLIGTVWGIFVGTSYQCNAATQIFNSHVVRKPSSQHIKPSLPCLA